MNAEAKSIVVLGAGLIGSAVLELVSRMSVVTSLTIVDQDRYSCQNRQSQLGVMACDLNQAKALVQARRASATNPRLRVRGICAAVEDVPWGVLKARVVLGCFDNDAARQSAAAAAWRQGVPYLDAGVNGPMGLARLTVIQPGKGQPCLECLWTDDRYAALGIRAPCQGGAMKVAATNSPAWLGGLAAALQAQQASLLLTQPAQAAIGRQLVMDVAHRKLYDGQLKPNPACRFAHEVWNIRQLAQGPAELSLGEALRADAKRRSQTPAALRVEGKSFVRKRVCPNGHETPVLRLQGRFNAQEQSCADCGAPLTELAFESVAHLAVDQLARAELRLPLSSLGFLPGDVFGVGRKGTEQFFELGSDRRGQKSTILFTEESYGPSL